MRLKFISSLLLASCLCACSANKPEAAAPEQSTQARNEVVNLYSSRHYDTDLALYENFTSQTGIKVNRIEADADALIERLKSEGELSPADLLITVDAGVLRRAEIAGVLSPSSSSILEERVPANLRHSDGLWYGLSKRARVIIYNKKAGKPAGLNNYEDLADPAHKGKVCMRSSSNIYNISLLASLIANNGIETAESWTAGMVNNFARNPQSNDSGQIEAVASGECGLSMVNTYYLARYARSDEAQKKEIFDSIGIVFPNQDGRGTHINISGASVTAHAPNRENAMKFLEYLTSKEAQNYFANGNNEYPVIKDANLSSAVETLGTFKEDSLNLSALGENQTDAVEIFDRQGWR